MIPTPNKTMLLSSTKYHTDTGEFEELYSVSLPTHYDNVDESVIHDWTEYKTFMVTKWVESHFVQNEEKNRYTLKLQSFPLFTVQISNGGKKKLKLPFNYFDLCL
jgi:hypothetical protein